jgi:hypothetical protein
LRAKLVASLLLAVPLLFPLASFADEEMEIVPPAKTDSEFQDRREPIDLEEIEITTLTPADRFVNATTPLVVALGLGSFALVAYTLVQGSKERDGE